MDKEKLISQSQHYGKVTKDFVVRQYHRLADFLAKKKIERRESGRNVILGMKCVKYAVILMSIFYMVSKLWNKFVNKFFKLIMHLFTI